MKHIIRHYFVPHKDNSFHPHAFRIEVVLGISAFLLLIEIAFLSTVVVLQTNHSLLATIFPGAVVEATNAERIAEDVAPVVSNKLLEIAAQRKAEAMAREGYFSHISPNGKTPWAWLREVGYEFSAAGENLAVNFFDSKDIARAWMDSRTHRANMLNGAFSEVGIGIAEGPYKGRNAFFVVQFFGTPQLNRRFLPVTERMQSIVTQRPFVASSSSQLKSVTSKVASPPLSQSAPDAGIVKSASKIIVNKPQASLLTRALGSSRATTNFIFLILGTVSFLILILALFMKMHVYHPQTLVQGSILLAVIGALFVLNYYVSVAHTSIL